MHLTKIISKRFRHRKETNFIILLRDFLAFIYKIYSTYSNIAGKLVKRYSTIRQENLNCETSEILESR